MSFGIDEALELERLLLVRAHWDKLANPPKPVLVAPVGPETHEKKAKPPWPGETKREASGLHYADLRRGQRQAFGEGFRSV